MSGNVRSEKKLNRRQEAALVALLAEPTYTAAAARARVSEKTLRRWLKRPEFQADTCGVARSSVFPAEPPVLPVMQH